MIINEVEKYISSYRAFLNSLVADTMKIEERELLNYDVKLKWFAKQGNIIPYADNPGLYFYTTKDGKILYIGKGNQEAEGGIGRRACAHLNKVEKDESGNPLFPYHQWKDYTEVEQDIKNLIKNGDFLIYTIEINPKEYVETFETFLQTLAIVQDGKLPVLNFKVG